MVCTKTRSVNTMIEALSMSQSSRLFKVAAQSVIYVDRKNSYRLSVKISAVHFVL